MRRKLSYFSFVALLLAVAGAWPAPALAYAGPAMPIAFADSSSLALAPGGDAMPVLVLNQAGHRIHVRVSIAGVGTPAVVSPVRVRVGSQTVATLDRPIPADIPYGGELVLDVAPVGTGDANLVVTDVGDDLTIRRPVSVSPAKIGKPAITSWKGTTSVEPSEDNKTIGVIPLRPGQTCGAGGDSPTAILVDGNDRVTVAATCSNAVLTMTAKGLDDVPAGVYSGTLTVAGTDVSLELTRRAPVWEAITALLIGILIALVIRSLAGRRPTWVLRADLAKLPSVTAPNIDKVETDLDKHLNAWKSAAVEQVAIAKHALANGCADDKLWPRWSRGKWNVLRWLFVPSTRAKKVVTDTESARAKAAAGTDAWNQHATQYLTALAQLSSDEPPSMGNLAARAHSIVNDPAKGLTEPSDSPDAAVMPRTGVDGLVALLDEAQAIATVAELGKRASVLLSQLPYAAAPAPTDDKLVDAAVARAWRESRADAQLRLTAIDQEIARAVDANALLADGLESRMHDASLVVDRLALQPPARTEERLREVGVTAADASQPGSWWQWVPGQVQRIGHEVSRAAARHAVVIGDLIAVLVATIVVITAGVATLYSGKAWGGGLDIAAAILAAVGGTLALTPIFAAIDNLGAGTDPPPPSDEDSA